MGIIIFIMCVLMAGIFIQMLGIERLLKKKLANDEKVHDKLDLIVKELQRKEQ